MIDKMVYDVLILGGGPVGCFAAYLANDKGLKTVLVESTNQLGGQPINLFAQKNITDYPGFASINAKQLVDNLVNQLKHHDEIDIFLNKQLISFKNQNGICNFVFNDGLIIETKFLIIATGNGSFFPNLLQIPGSENNKKLHYIVQPYEEYNDKKVIILGGGDSAVDWANNLANKTTADISIIHRRDIFRANGENVKLLSKNNVDILLNKECLKINDNLDEKLKFKSECLSRTDNAYKNSLIYEYNCAEQGLYEVGEVNDKNCKNDYPFAMAFKRCFDRVVLKNSKLAFAGVYSEEEADEFKQKFEEKNELNKELVEQLIGLGGTLDIVSVYFKVNKNEFTNEHIQKLIDLKLENMAKNENN